MNNRDKVKKYVTMFGMEAEDADLDTGLIEEEANRNEDYDYEENPINLDLGGDDDWGDDEPDELPENEEGVTYEDKKITPDEELIQEEAKAANLVKLSGTHINGYVSNMVNILSSGLIERTGSFIANDYQASFIEPAEEIIAKCFAQDDTIKKFQEFRELLDQKSLMSKLAGTETTPFVYEGMQVTYLLALTAALSLVGTSLQINGTLPDTAKHIGFKAFNDILEAIDAILSVKSSLGTKIYYTDTVVDIDDNPQASLYVNIKEVNPSIGGVSSVPAGESIGNIIEIRNNGALMDYLLVMKALEKMSFIATKIEFKDITSKVLRAASDILSIDMQNDNGEEALATIVETVRNDIIAVLDSDDAITGEVPIEDGDNLGTRDGDGDLPPDDGSLPDNIDDFNEDEVENIGSESLEITLNAIGQHFSDILHSKSFKIGVAVTGAYLLFNGIGKLCKYYVNKKIKENQDKYIEEKALKFKNEEDLKGFIKAYDAALKRSGATISKEVKNKLPIYNMFCKLCGDKKYKVDIKRWYPDYDEILDSFNSGELTFILSHIIDEPFDYKELDWYMRNVQIAFMKENNEVKAILGNDSMKTNLIINLDKRTGDKLADSFLDELKKFATDAIDGGDNYELDKERFMDVFSNYYWKEVQNFSEYVKEVVENEIARWGANIRKGCVKVDIDDIDMLPSITIGVIKMEDNIQAVESVDYGYGYESFWGAVGSGIASFAKGTAMVIGGTVLFAVTVAGLAIFLSHRNEKKRAGNYKKEIEDAMFTFNSEADVVNYINKERTAINKVNKSTDIGPTSFPVLNLIAYLSNSKLELNLEPRIQKQDLLNSLSSSNSYIPYRIKPFNKGVTLSSIMDEVDDNLIISGVKDKNDNIALVISHKITKKSVSFTEGNNSKYGKLGEFVDEYLGKLKAMNDKYGDINTESIGEDLVYDIGDLIWNECDDILVKIQDAYYIEMGIQNKAKVSFNNTQLNDGNRPSEGDDIVIPMRLVGGANV
jgi:hypothetical protein